MAYKDVCTDGKGQHRNIDVAWNVGYQPTSITVKSDHLSRIFFKGTCTSGFYVLSMHEEHLFFLEEPVFWLSLEIVC